jgi:hypothetical protein
MAQSKLKRSLGADLRLEETSGNWGRREGKRHAKYVA